MERYERIIRKVGEEASAYLDNLLSKLCLTPDKVQFNDESTFKVFLGRTGFYGEIKKGSDKYRLFLDEIKDSADFFDKDFNKEFEAHRTSYAYRFFTGLEAGDFYWIDFRFDVSLSYDRTINSVRLDAILFDPIKHKELENKRGEIENIASEVASKINTKYHPRSKNIELWGFQGWASRLSEEGLWYATWPDKRKGEENINALVDATKLFAERVKRKFKKSRIS